MIHLIYGTVGSGKTSYLLSRIKERLVGDPFAFLLVPEQNTVATEKLAAAALPPSAPLSFEVTNFTRLADTVFRSVGGVSRRPADKGTEALLLYKTLHSLFPMLTDTRKIDTGRIQSTAAAIKQIEAAALTPRALTEAADALPKGSPLSDKLYDLALILSEYALLLSEKKHTLPGEELERLAKALAEEDPLPSAVFYCDDFTSFTARQLAVLRTLSRRHDLYITLGLPQNGDERRSLYYIELQKTALELQKIAAEEGIPLQRTVLSENKRVKSPLIKEVGRALSLSEKSLPTEDLDFTDIRILECRSPFEEAELVAADIAKWVREGAHYRDFAILAGNAADYRGVLDVALSRLGIPCFFSLPRDLSSFEAVKLIKSAYAVCLASYRRSDVITYLKCGFSGLSQDLCDRFEAYVERWRLTGPRILRSPFRMRPSGYAHPQSEEEQRAADEELLLLNNARKTLSEPLSLLEKYCKGRFTVNEHCEGLYQFLSLLSVEEQLLVRAEADEKENRRDEAELRRRLYTAMMAILDRLVEEVGELSLYARDFLELLSLQFSMGSLQTIPPYADAVSVGSAGLMRPGNPLHAYLIGVNADIFPETAEEGGIFTAFELTQLEKVGILLDADPLVRAAHTHYCFLRAFLSAGESVTLSYYLSDFSFRPAKRSDVIDRVIRLCGDALRPLSYRDIAPEDKIFCEEDILRLLSRHPDPTLQEALWKTLAGRDSETLAKRLGAKLLEAEERVSPEEMKAILPEKMTLSQSRIATYSACPFSYFCKYILRLDDNAHADITRADIGTFIHAVMEGLFTLAQKEETPISELSDEALSAMVKTVSADYMAALFPNGETPLARVSHLFGRLEKAALRILAELREEAKHSSFTPHFFEYSPDEKKLDAPSPLSFPLSGGGSVSLNGKIDRVDLYREEDRVYLRVIDYKTGKKTFSLEKVAAGEDLQLLLYLFTLWKSDRPAFLASLGMKEGDRLLPAGALYLSTDLNEATVKSPDGEGEGATLCHRSGLLLMDESSLSAMDDTGSGRFIPIRCNKDGSVCKTDLDKLASLEKMGELLSAIEDTVTELCVRLKSGCAEATPQKAGRISPCLYCKWKPICRHAEASS